MKDDENLSQEAQGRRDAEQHVAKAHSLLSNLRQKFDAHPELEEAIRSLELALSVLTVKTNAML